MQVGQHLLGNKRQLNKDEFKIVYVAPMKALAAEVTATFARRLQPLGASWLALCTPQRQGCATAANITGTPDVCAARQWGASLRTGTGTGLLVRELTGDMQLTQREMAETHMIVTTPEKWDVITRKACPESTRLQCQPRPILPSCSDALEHQRRTALLSSSLPVSAVCTPTQATAVSSLAHVPRATRWRLMRQLLRRVAMWQPRPLCAC